MCASIKNCCFTLFVCLCCVLCYMCVCVYKCVRLSVCMLLVLLHYMCFCLDDMCAVFGVCFVVLRVCVLFT